MDRDVHDLAKAGHSLPEAGLRPPRAAAAALLAALLLAGCAGEPPPPLPALNIDPARVSVSGLSAGAYMAQQLHMAYSDRIAGAALLAGGPYGCAAGDLQRALGGCMAPPEDALPDVMALADSVRQRAAEGGLAPVAGLVGDRVLVWRGRLDGTISEPVSRAAAALYRELVDGVLIVEAFDDEVAHLFPTAAGSAPCDVAEPPFIAGCGVDLAGELIRSLHPDTGAAPTEPGGSLRVFDAAAYANGDPPGAATGYVYVPVACERGERCGLHIALHGCQQDAASIGEAFVAGAGYNRWADAAKLVVLYPQAAPSYAPLNPRACWDWWGYSGADYDTREGAQLRWIAQMAAALGASLE